MRLTESNIKLTLETSIMLLFIGLVFCMCGILAIISQTKHNTALSYIADTMHVLRVFVGTAIRPVCSI